MDHRWESQGSSGKRCRRCGLFRYTRKGKEVYALNGYVLKRRPNCAERPIVR